MSKNITVQPAMGTESSRTPTQEQALHIILVSKRLKLSAVGYLNFTPLKIYEEWNYISQHIFDLCSTWR
jgi:hypothetical protein